MFITALVVLFIICTYMYANRHAITKYTRKINKSYSIQKIRCFMMNGSMDTNCLGLIISNNSGINIFSKI